MNRYLQALFLTVIWSIASFAPALSQGDPSHPVITIDNAHNLTQTAILGRGVIHDVHWSPDGYTLAASTSRGIWLFSASSPYTVDNVVEPHLLDGGGDIAFSPDSSLLVSGVEDTIQIWDTAHAALRFTENIPGDKFFFGFSADSKRLAVTSFVYDFGSEAPVIVWSLEANQLTPLTTITVPDTRMIALALNSDGSLLAAADPYREIHLFSLPDGNEFSTVETTYMAYRGAKLTFSADSRRLLAHIMDVAMNSVPLDGIYLWDVEALLNGAQATAQVYAIDTSNVDTEPTFNHDQSILALYTGLDFIVLLDTETGQERGRLRSSTSPGYLAFSPDNNNVIAIDAYDGRVWIWNVQQAFDYGIARVTLPEAVEPNIEAALDQFPDVPRPPTQFDSQSSPLNGHQQPVTAVFFSPNGQQIISHAADGTTRIWDAITNEPISLITHDRGSESMSALSLDGRLIANVLWNSDIELWDINSGLLIRTLEGHTQCINALAFAPPNAVLASGSGGLCSGERDPSLRLWQVLTGDNDVLQDNANVRTVAFSPDGEHLVSGGDAEDHHNLCIWDTETGELQQTLGDYAVVSDVEFSPNGNFLAVSSELTAIDIWDMSTSTPYITMRLEQSDNNSSRLLTFSPDGTILVVASGQDVSLWNTVSGQRAAIISLSAPITSLAFAPDGTQLAFGLRDGTIRLWGIPQ
jgi:WD40 repeat protein